MGLLIRAAFWFSLVLLALPFGTGTDETGRETVGPLQALMAAREAVGDIAGICERKPEVCETGKSAMHTITVRAKHTAAIAAEMLDDDATASTATTKPIPAQPVAASVETVELPDTVNLTGSVLPKS